MEVERCSSCSKGGNDGGQAEKVAVQWVLLCNTQWDPFVLCLWEHQPQLTPPSAFAAGAVFSVCLMSRLLRLAPSKPNCLQVILRPNTN